MGTSSKPKKNESRKVAAAPVRQQENGLGRAGLILLSICAAGLFASICCIIFAFTKAFFHSDSAYYVQLAVEQMKTGKHFPPGMSYSTVLFVRSPTCF